jgi:hypothetical protein
LLDIYQLSITDEPVFEIHCVSEETDLFRNGGIEDIARLIIDQNKISTDDVNVIVKGKRKELNDWKNTFFYEYI